MRIVGEFVIVYVCVRLQLYIACCCMHLPTESVSFERVVLLLVGTVGN